MYEELSVDPIDERISATYIVDEDWDDFEPAELNTIIHFNPDNEHAYH